MIDHTRHMGIFDVSKLDVILMGAGGIGALTAITLGKMGVGSMEIFDDDYVDPVNIATQFHTVSDIGKRKSETVTHHVVDFGNQQVKGYCSRVSQDLILRQADVYISTVDSIISRQGIWQSILNSNIFAPMQGFYLDARMGAEIFEMFVVDLANCYWYEHHLLESSDSDMPDLPCTSKATIYTAAIAAGHIGATVRRIVTGQQQPGFLQHDIVNNQLSYLEM